MRSSWTIRDFVIIWLSGLAGGLLFGLAGLVISRDWSLILGLAGGLGSQLATLWILYRGKSEPDLRLILEFSDVAYLLLGGGLQFALALLLAPLAEILLPDGGPIQDVPRELANPDTSSLVRISAALLLVLVAPLAEELLYRGVLFSALAHRGATFVTVVTAAVFSGVHIVTLTPPLVESAALVLPPLFVIGLVLARLTLRSGRLGPAIMTHMGFNTITALVLLIPSEVLESLTS